MNSKQYLLAKVSKHLETETKQRRGKSKYLPPSLRALKQFSVFKVGTVL